MINWKGQVIIFFSHSCVTRACWGLINKTIIHLKNIARILSIPVLTEAVIVEGLSGPVSNWFRKGISSSASLLKLQAVQVKHSVLIFQFIHSVLERNIQYWSLFTWNFQFEEYEMSKCGDMGKSLPYALRYVLLPVQCYFWWYSKICQIWRVIFSATLQKLLHFETKS